jgi:hypothetical protein
MERPLDKRKLPKILITKDVLEKKKYEEQNGTVLTALGCAGFRFQSSNEMDERYFSSDVIFCRFCRVFERNKCSRLGWRRSRSR